MSDRAGVEAPERVVRTGEAGARIAGQLREAILDGRYAPGARIRQEDLADRHGASRVPVREALRMLETEGLVSVVPNAGAWVARLSLDECQELYRIRERIEPLLLRLNTPVMPAETIERLGDLADLMERADPEEFLRLDRAFHLEGYATVPTIALGELVQRFWNQTQHYRRAFTYVFQHEGDTSVHHEHHLIVHALQRRDEDEAERVLGAHIRRTRIELARHPEIFA